jgi:hypothetical protein
MDKPSLESRARRSRHHKPRSKTLRKFLARMRFMDDVYPNLEAFLAIPEFSELLGMPTGMVIKIGSVSGDLYKVTMAEHERSVRRRKERLKERNLAQRRIVSGGTAETNRDLDAMMTAFISVKDLGRYGYAAATIGHLISSGRVRVKGTGANLRVSFADLVRAAAGVKTGMTDEAVSKRIEPVSKRIET